MRSVVCLSGCLLALAPVAFAAPRALTSKDAISAVRAFEARPTLKFRDVRKESAPAEVGGGNSVWFALNGKSGVWADRMWKVDAHSGEVIGATYGDAMPKPAATPPEGKSVKQCLEAATTFAGRHYKAFDKSGLKLVAAEWMGTGWRFEWRQQIAYGAWTMNGVEIEVNGADGRVQAYTVDRVTVRTPRPPKATDAQALATARDAVNQPGATPLRAPQLICDPEGRLIWSIMLTARQNDGTNAEYEVTVDAYTGNVINSARYAKPTRGR